MYYIGYDIGSSSVKIALVETESKKRISIISEPSEQMEIISIKPNWAEQDPEKWWEYLCKGTKRILLENNIDAKQILSIGISYQMHGLVLVDTNKKLLRDAIIWCDSRAVDIGKKAAKELGEEKYGKHLLNSPGNFTASKLKWVKENEKKIFARTSHFMLPGDYIAFKLTNEITTTKNGLSEGMLWDYKEKKLADWLLDYYKIDVNLAPPIVDNFENQGNVTPKAALETGLPIGIPIRYRAGDQPNNALSLNVLHPGEVAASGGTSGVLFAVSDQSNSKEFNRLNHFAHVNYTNEKPIIGSLLCINGVGIQYSWLKKITKSTSFSEMNELAGTVDVGSQGLMNFPFGNGSERMFNDQSLGANFCNLNLNIHKQEHLFRSALEGIAFSFVYGMEIMNADGIDVEVIRAGNDNLFQSKIFSTTISSLIGRPIEIYNTTGAEGAARAAGFQKGELNDWSRSMNDLDKVIEILPKPDALKYKESYNKWKIVLEQKINNNDNHGK